MPNKKPTELNELAQGNIVNDDLVVVTDISETEDKKFTWASLKGALGSMFIGQVSDDTSPQLGGTLDPDGNDIGSSGSRVPKIWATNIDVTDILITGVAEGDSDMDGNDIKDLALGTFRIYAIGNSSTSFNIDWNNGAYQSVTLTGNASVGTQTAPSMDANNGVRLQLDIVQDGTGGRDFTPPANWVFPEGEPTWTDGTANQRMVVTLMHEGNNYVVVNTSWFTNP